MRSSAGRSVVGSVSVLGIEGHRFEPYRSEKEGWSVAKREGDCFWYSRLWVRFLSLQ